MAELGHRIRKLQRAHDIISKEAQNISRKVARNTKNRGSTISPRNTKKQRAGKTDSKPGKQTHRKQANLIKHYRDTERRRTQVIGNKLYINGKYATDKQKSKIAICNLGAAPLLKADASNKMRPIWKCCI